MQLPPGPLRTVALGTEASANTLASAAAMNNNHFCLWPECLMAAASIHDTVMG